MHRIFLYCRQRNFEFCHARKVIPHERIRHQESLYLLVDSIMLLPEICLVFVLTKWSWKQGLDRAQVAISGSFNVTKL